MTQKQKWLNRYLTTILLMVLILNISQANIEISNIHCHDNGTIDNNLDDMFSFDIRVTGIVNNWYSIVLGDTIMGQNGITQTYGPFLITSGEVELPIFDNQTGMLIGKTTVFPPFSCSDDDAETTIYLCKDDSITLEVETNNHNFFQWYRNGSEVIGAVNDILTLSESGIYEFRAGYDSNFVCYDKLGTLISLILLEPPHALDLTVSFCPAMTSSGDVSKNDLNVNQTEYRLISPTLNGNLIFDSTGNFSYTPMEIGCGTDQFTYEVCNLLASCCDTAVCFINLEDNTPPNLQNVPADLTISCDEQLPESNQVLAFDSCPGIYVLMEEEVIEGDTTFCSYIIQRTWTVTDLCGNMTSASQIITVEDREPPSVFKVHTLPNGQKMIGGVSKLTGHRKKSIVFPIQFETPPLVFTQVITINEAMPVTTRIEEVTKTGFTLFLQEEDTADGYHIWEEIAWIAVEPGIQNISKNMEMSLLDLNDSWQAHSFNQTYLSTPAVFAQVQTTTDLDPLSVRYRNKTVNSIEVLLQEESSVSSDLSHSVETTAFWVADTISTFQDISDNNIGEFGIIQIQHEWVIVSLKNQYQNPIVIGGTIGYASNQASTIRVRNVTQNSFEIRVEEWDYLDKFHAWEEVGYLVIEGSFPIDDLSGCKNLENLTKDDFNMTTIDNCGISMLDFQNNWADTTGNNLILNRTWSVYDNCGNIEVYTQNITCSHAVLSVKVMLQGALQDNGGDELMRDDLRKKALIPKKEPYSEMEGFEHKGSGGEETVSHELLNIEGENAVVDWVFVEIRDSANNSNILETRSALLQRDGNIMDINGDTIIHFYNTPIGSYYVSIRHRNHLGAITPSTRLLSEISHLVDFSKMNAGGDAPQKELNGIKMMWAGNANKDGQVIYQGPQNDVFKLLIKVLESSQNTSFLANYVHFGYSTTDLNLDGKTIYQGPDNERSRLLFNTIMVHPSNINKLPNYIVEEQLPEN